MIIRIWHGYTTPENAEAYEQLLKSKIFKDIEAKTGEGFESVELLKRHLNEGEVEFTTMMRFKDLDTIRKFTGEDHETAYVPEEARKLLVRFNQKVAHLELRYVAKK
ncbi:hypothetical protein [Salinimicrobium sediminilitoris]|uniref:hypothetical protein n=1 Tax=Salinimicrobium sediminilitoris TaxID=2876715 RepID=UPI001E59F8F1|nr:hypothetical protein [Salinimicrobium sediminilitoris]MCC8359568.1 hypothetical protein [Salinimicrobium sediminilitoris]